MYESSPIAHLRTERTYQSRPGNPGGDFKSSSVTRIPIGTNFRSGVENPFRKGQIASISSAGTPFTGEKWEVTSTPSSLWCKRYESSVKRVWTYDTSGDIFTPEFSAVLMAETTANNQAIMGFINAARQAQSALAGGVFLGELRETISMIANPAKTLRASVDGYFDALIKRRRLAPRGRARNPYLRDVLSDTWLEYSFGWKPLMNDIDAAYTAFKQLALDDREFEVVQGFGSDDESISYPSTQQTYNNYNYIIKHKKLVRSVTVRYKGAVKLNVATSAMSRTNEIFSMNIEDFIPTIWELIPYSFLADYFINIGDIISATTFLRSKIAWVNKTARFRSIVQVSGQIDRSRQASVLGTNYRGSGGKPGGVSVDYRRIVRTQDVPLVPDLEFSIPGLSTKWINMAALLNKHASIRPYI